jgi:hypothetical protein
MNEPPRRKRRSLPPVQREQISLAFGSMGLRGEGRADEGQADEGQADEGQADEGQADEGQADEGQADEGHHPTVATADARGRRGKQGERRRALRCCRRAIEAQSNRVPAPVYADAGRCRRTSRASAGNTTWSRSPDGTDLPPSRSSTMTWAARTAAVWLVRVSTSWSRRCAQERSGAVLCLVASRLARNGRDWHHLLELCGLVGARVIDTDGIYDRIDRTTDCCWR